MKKYFTLDTVNVPMNAGLMIKKPGRHRTSFCVHLVQDSGCPKLRLQEIELINTAFKSGEIGLFKATELVEDIRAELYKIRDTNRKRSSKENLLICRAFIEETYPKWKQRRMEQSSFEHACWDYKRVCNAIGDHSLQSISKDQLQNIIDDTFESWHTHKRSVECANNLISFLGRNFRIETLPRPDSNIAFHTPDQFNRVIKHIDNEVDISICGVALYGGFRFGEACAFGRRQSGVLMPLEASGGFQISIEKQLKANLLFGPTKNRRKRNAIYYGEGKDFMKFWWQLSLEEKKKVRNRSGTKNPNVIYKKACRAAGVPRIRFHDLRHSYAIMLLNDGLPIKVVADMIGDSVSCCENYYTGKVRHAHTIEAVGTMIELNRKKLTRKSDWWE